MSTDSGARHVSLPLRVGAATHAGKVRTENQDRMSRFVTGLGEAFVVLDGMGGHADGSRAAAVALDAIERALAGAAPSTPPPDALRAAATLAHDEVRAAAGGATMGATGVLALCSGPRAWVAHVGDCRAYRLRRGRLERLTRDHTVVQRLIDEGTIDEEQARSHPDAGVVTRALGVRESVVVDVSEPLDVEPGDLLLLCSDGLSGCVPDHDLARAATSAPGAQEAAEALVELALAAGGEDNVTVQVLRFGGGRDAAGGPAEDRGEDAAPRPSRLLPWFVAAAILAAALVALALTR